MVDYLFNTYEVNEDDFSFFAGGEMLISKLRFFRPRIAVFNGKGIYEIFSGKKDFQFGKQPEMFPHSDTVSLCEFLYV